MNQNLRLPLLREFRDGRYTTWPILWSVDTRERQIEPALCQSLCFQFALIPKNRGPLDPPNGAVCQYQIFAPTSYPYTFLSPRRNTRPFWYLRRAIEPPDSRPTDAAAFPSRSVLARSVSSNSNLTAVFIQFLKLLAPNAEKCDGTDFCRWKLVVLLVISPNPFCIFGLSSVRP